MSNKLFLLPVVLFSIVSCTNSRAVKDKKPNIIIILTDDQGYRHLSARANYDLAGINGIKYFGRSQALDYFMF
jgi:hypothetical protein